MNRSRLFYFTVLLVLMANVNLYAQSRSALEDQGYDHLNNQDYVKAFDVFDKLSRRYPEELDYKMKLGIAALNLSDKKEKAIEIFAELRDKYRILDAEIYLGKAYHRNYKFDDAIIILQPLLENLQKSKKKKDLDMIPEVEMIIRNCVNGNFLIKNKVFADISNIGPPINTSELEGVPVITADESMMIFTYVGKKSLGGKQNAQMKEDPNGMYLSDIYMSLRDSAGNKWMPPVALDALNTKGNDAAIALSPDGLTLFTFLSNNENEGDILVSQLTGSVFSTPVPLNENINTPDYWEGSCSISADGKYLYFSSERPGGHGGRDIWMSEIVDGDWGPAVNLGSNINTPYDDDAPFIHPDGITLFFSSKGHMSIGGYDIMFSIKEGNDWTEPKSMGIPLNTTEDDSYYVINSKGDKGYFSSTRSGSGGLGSQDIYMVTPGILGEKPVVALIKGTVYGDDKPIAANIEVVKQAKNENIGPYHTNAGTGKYLMALSPGNIYRIKVHAEGFESVEEDLDVEHLNQFMEQNKDFYLFSKEITRFTEKPKEAEPLAAQPVQQKTQEERSAPLEEPLKEQPVQKQPQELTTDTPETKNKEIIEPVKQALAKEDEPAEPELEVKKTRAEEKKTEKQVAAKGKKTPEPKPEKQTFAKEKITHDTKDQPEAEPEVAVSPCDNDYVNLSDLRGLSLNDETNYKKLLKIAGNFCADNLLFKVQIGAFRKPENFKYEKFSALGKIESTTYPDGLTRFTQKEFYTLKEAEKLRQKLIAKGIKDAWIVAFVGDKRYTLEDFIMVDFLSQPVN